MAYWRVGPDSTFQIYALLVPKILGQDTIPVPMQAAVAFTPAITPLECNSVT